MRDLEVHPNQSANLFKQRYNLFIEIDSQFQDISQNTIAGYHKDTTRNSQITLCNLVQPVIKNLLR
jgi:hypothetical protein